MWEINIGDLVGFIGFAITIWQIRRAASIAETAKNAVESASLRASVYQILLISPQFEKCEAQLETAAMQGDTNLIFERLREWRRITSEMLGLLDESDELHKPVVNQLQATAGLASVAKKKVLSSGPSDLMKNTEKIREAASDAAGLVVTLAAQIKTDLKPLDPRS